MYGLEVIHTSVRELAVNEGRVSVNGILYLSAGHTKEIAGVLTECLLIDKVAPAAYALSDKEAENSYIEHRQYLDLAHPAYYQSDRDRTDNSAVYGKSALTGIHNRLDRLAEAVLLVFVKVKCNIIESRADYASEYSSDDRIDRSVGIESEALHTREAVQECKQQTYRYQYAVPLYLDASYFKSSRINVKSPAELREVYLIGILYPVYRHNYPSPSMTDITSLSRLSSFFINARASSEVIPEMTFIAS